MSDSYDKPHMILYVLDQADLPGPLPFTTEDHNSVKFAIKSVKGRAENGKMVVKMVTNWGNYPDPDPPSLAALH